MGKIWVELWRMVDLYVIWEGVFSGKGWKATPQSHRFIFGRGEKQQRCDLIEKALFHKSKNPVAFITNLLNVLIWRWIMKEELEYYKQECRESHLV